MKSCGVDDHSGGCNGVPHECEHAQRLLMEATDGFGSPGRAEALKSELANCDPCLAALELELGFQQMVALHCRVQAPENLRIRISETLKRVELDSLDITDLSFPPQG